MSIVEVRCPRCGSPCGLKDRTTGEYRCEHCETTFRLIDSTTKTVIRDTLAHNCSICGRPVKVGEGYVCRECGKEYLCSKCVQRIGGRFVCVECLKLKGLIVGPYTVCPICKGQLSFIKKYNRWYCFACEKYVSHICPQCGETATYNKKKKKFYCNYCKTEVKPLCPTCRAQLSFVPQNRRWYCYECKRYV